MADIANLHMLIGLTRSNQLQFLRIACRGPWPFFVRCNRWSRTAQHVHAVAMGPEWHGSTAPGRLLPGVSPPAFHGLDGSVAVYFEVVAIAGSFNSASVELKAREQTRAQSPADLAPRRRA